MYICIISFAFLCHFVRPKKIDLSHLCFPGSYAVSLRAWHDQCYRYGPGHWRKIHWQKSCVSRKLQGCRRKTWNRSWLVAACWAACCSSKVAKVLLLLLKKRGIAIMWYLYNWFTTRTPLFSSENPLILMLDISGASSHMVTGQYHHVGSPVVSCCDLVPATSCNIRMGHRMWISWDPLYHRCTMFGLCFAGYFHEFRFQTVSFSDGSTA